MVESPTNLRAEGLALLSMDYNLDVSVGFD